MTEVNKPRHAAEPDPAHTPDTEAPDTEAPAADATTATSLDTAGGAMRPSAVPVSAQSGTVPGGPDSLLRKIFTGSGMVSVLAVLLALILGGLLIASTDKEVSASAGYLFARPSDFFSAVWSAATRSYVALFQTPCSTRAAPAWPGSSPR